MWKTAADISSSDQAILKGILEGFGEVSDINKIDKFNTEVKRIFSLVKQDSKDLPDSSLYQIAFHMSRNRANHLLKKKDVVKEVPKEVLPEKQPTIERHLIEENLTEVPVIPSTELTLNISSEPLPEKRTLTIRRAISDGFDFVEGIGKATTKEHLYDEAQRLFAWYINKFNETVTSQEVYETVFMAAKKVAEEILTAHKNLVEQEDRRDMRAKKKEEAAQAEIERQRISEVSKIELKELIAKLLTEKEFSKVGKEALKYFKLIYLDGKSDPEVVHLFPGTSRDQRYQWKSRAVGIIAPYASEDARRYISEKTKRKFAFAPDVILKAAQTFLVRCKDRYE